MSGDAVLVVADTLRTHEWRGNFLGCGCGWNWPEELTHFCGEDERIAKAHADHVAAAVVDALGGLGRAWAPVFDDDSFIAPPFHEKHERWPGDARTRAEQAADHEDASLAFRWVSGWVREPAEEDGQ